MAFNVAALVDYVVEKADSLKARTILTPKTAALIQAGGTVMTGVKSSEKIGQVEADAILQVGACGFTPSGSLTFSQRTVVVGDIKVEDELCMKDLEKKYTSQMLTAGATYDNPEDFQFNKWWIDRKIALTALALETAIWSGDTASGNGQLNKFDGLIKLINAAADEINANVVAFIAVPVTAAAGITEANAIQALQAVVKATPKELKEQDDYRVFVGYDVIEAANFALYAANKFHHTSENPDEFTIPGTRIKAIGVPGLSAAKGLFGMRLSNMVLATDLLSDETEVKVWYNVDADSVRYRNAFKYGVNVGFTAECVKFIPTP